MNLDDFIQRYPARPPKKPPANIDENRLLRHSDGLVAVAAPPFPETFRAHPSGADQDRGRHLWAFIPGEPQSTIPAILELKTMIPPLESGRVKHSNLTGGGWASCGGELWIDPAEGRLFINGASGRYGPDTLEQLEHAAEVFESLGYKTVHFGFDEGVPARFYRDY